LDSLVKNEGMLGHGVWTLKRRQEMEALPLTGWRGQRRTDLMAMLEDLNRRLAPLDDAVRQAAEEDPEARLLMTHPGVGPMVSLA
jgi:transposase